MATSSITTTIEVCEDKETVQFCKNKLENGKCTKEMVIEKCKLTCGICQPTGSTTSQATTSGTPTTTTTTRTPPTTTSGTPTPITTTIEVCEDKETVQFCKNKLE